MSTKTRDKKYYNCEKDGHLARNCPQRRRGSTNKNSRPTYFKKVSATEERLGNMEAKLVDPLDLLYSSFDEETDIQPIQVTDEDSQSQLAHVIVQGVPADGVIDTGVDITIIGRDLFTKVAAATRLSEKNFRKPDKVT